MWGFYMMKKIWLFSATLLLGLTFSQAEIVTFTHGGITSTGFLATYGASVLTRGSISDCGKKSEPRLSTLTYRFFSNGMMHDVLIEPVSLELTKISGGKHYTSSTADRATIVLTKTNIETRAKKTTTIKGDVLFNSLPGQQSNGNAKLVLPAGWAGPTSIEVRIDFLGTIGSCPR